ncbi:MAG: hypothetical protein KF901_17075 [Myxococcales bacterium]|nr:hypothetical protein [Myxococcales bacterium]
MYAIVIARFFLGAGALAAEPADVGGALGAVEAGALDGAGPAGGLDGAGPAGALDAAGEEAPASGPTGVNTGLSGAPGACDAGAPTGTAVTAGSAPAGMYAIVCFAIFFAGGEEAIAGGGDEGLVTSGEGGR